MFFKCEICLSKHRLKKFVGRRKNIKKLTFFVFFLHMCYFFTTFAEKFKLVCFINANVCVKIKKILENFGS